MTNEKEIKAKFWKALKSDRTMFLGLADGEDGHARPMTAQLDDEGSDGDDYHGPIWFFTSTDNSLYQQITMEARATGGQSVGSTLNNAKEEQSQIQRSSRRGAADNNVALLDASRLR